MRRPSPATASTSISPRSHLGVENWPHLPLPSSLRPQLPPELDGLLLGAMSFERTKRPDDCVILEETLEAIMKKHGLTASDKDIARWVASEIALVQPTCSEPTAMETPAWRPRWRSPLARK